MSVLVSGACPDRSGGPRPLEVVPGSAQQGQVTAVRILGQAFVPLVHASYDDEQQSRVSTGFTARLGDHSLVDVTFVGATELSAVVPADLPAGIHALTVVDPSGAAGSLPEAFTVTGISGDGAVEAGADGGADGRIDGPPGDGRPDGPVSPDSAHPDTVQLDTLSPDTTVQPDTGTIAPLSAAQVGATYLKTQVQCVNANGNPQGGQIPIVDSGSVSFVQGAVTLQGAPNDTKNWVGSLPSVTVVWDLNACDAEDPIANDGDWTSAGLLIRGATINASGQLVLQPGRTTGDIDFINVNPDGTFQNNADFAQPSDSGLSAYPQLVNTITAAKQTLITLSGS